MNILTGMQNLLHELFLSSYKTKQSFKDNISEDIQFSTQKYKMKTCVFCPTILNDKTPDADTEIRIR